MTPRRCHDTHVTAYLCLLAQLEEFTVAQPTDGTASNRGPCFASSLGSLLRRPVPVRDPPAWHAVAGMALLSTVQHSLALQAKTAAAIVLHVARVRLVTNDSR